jgi:hypothetical protein
VLKRTTNLKAITLTVSTSECDGALRKPKIKVTTYM